MKYLLATFVVGYVAAVMLLYDKQEPPPDGCRWIRTNGGKNPSWGLRCKEEWKSPE